MSQTDREGPIHRGSPGAAITTAPEQDFGPGEGVDSTPTRAAVRRGDAGSSQAVFRAFASRARRSKHSMARATTPDTLTLPFSNRFIEGSDIPRAFANFA